MSTRSHIYLKLKDESKGQTIKFHITELAGSYRKNKKNLRHPIPAVTIPKYAKYMRVFHHFDSTIVDLGIDLLRSYNTYDKVLNLLTMGDLDSIYCSEGGVKSKQGFYGVVSPARFIDDNSKIKRGVRDENGHFKPTLVPYLENGELPADNANIEGYAYLFDGEKWYVTHDWWDEENQKYVREGWRELEEVIELAYKDELKGWDTFVLK